MEMNSLRTTLVNATAGCEVQDGWPCGTCFFDLSDELTNEDWQLVLLLRGDYAEKDLGNLPKNRDKSLKKIIEICSRRG